MSAWYFPQLKEFKPIAGFEFVFSNDGSSYPVKGKKRTNRLSVLQNKFSIYIQLHMN